MLPKFNNKIRACSALIKAFFWEGEFDFEGERTYSMCEVLLQFELVSWLKFNGVVGSIPRGALRSLWEPRQLADQYDSLGFACLEMLINYRNFDHNHHTYSPLITNNLLFGSAIPIMGKQSAWFSKKYILYQTYNYFFVYNTVLSRKSGHALVRTARYSGLWIPR